MRRLLFIGCVIYIYTFSIDLLATQNHGYLCQTQYSVTYTVTKEQCDEHRQLEEEQHKFGNSIPRVPTGYR